MATFIITQLNPNKEVTYLYPNADSQCIEWTPFGDAPNYTCVDDRKNVPDYLTTYVHTELTTYEQDLYKFDNCTIAGTIEYVQIKALVSSQYPPTANVDFKFIVSEEDEIYYPDEDLTDGWVEEEGVHPGEITAIATEVEWDELWFGDSMYFAKDYGTDYFGEFSHCFTYDFANIDDDPFVVWGINDGIYDGGSIAAMGDYSEWSIYWGWECLKLDNTTWTLESRKSPNTNTDSWNSAGAYNPLYINIVRNATTLHAYFYSDVAMTTLVQHLEVADLNTGTEFKYAYLGATPDSASVQNVGFTISDFNIHCDKNCDNIYESNSKNITTGWRKIDYIWTENPVTSVAWTADDINNIVAGYKAKSAALNGSINLVLRPNAVGDTTDLTRGGTNNYGANYKQVYEEISDGNDSYVYEPDGDPPENLDLYNIENDTANVLAGATINYIEVFGVFKWEGGVTFPSPTFYVKTGGVTDTKSGVPLHNAWTLQAKRWSTNPDTSVAWTQADINALQIGAELDNFAYMTQMYVIVNYTPATAEPEIRVTQCYLKIVHTPDEHDCTLNRPQQISTNHARNIKMLNFWNGDREVYDLNRSGKSMVLTGTENGASACDTILCVRNMARNGAVVTVSTLSPTYFNGNYRIRQFGWNKISEKPEHYRWILSLEQAD